MWIRNQPGLAAPNDRSSASHIRSAHRWLAATAAIVTLVALGPRAHSAELGAYTLQRLTEMQARHPMIGHVAGLGLHLGIDLVTDRETKARAVEEAEAVMFKCLERGVSLKTIDGNVLTLRPALVITQAQMDQALGVIEEAIDEVERGIGYGR